MEVIKARYLGFCQGVKRALDIAMTAIGEARRIDIPCYIYGDIVHNSNVMDTLLRAGVIAIDSPDGHMPGVLIVRTHGIDDGLRSAFISKGFIIKDATCPVVLKNQEMIRDSLLPIVIIGLNGHSEVSSLVGSAKGHTIVIESEEDLSKLNKTISYNMVVQTTFSSSGLERIMKKIKELSLDITLLNDICPSSQLRRDSVKNLKGKVDAMVIVGDKHSANTMELFNIAKESGLDSFLVDNKENIASEIGKYAKIGLSAGASTPDYIYNEVEACLRSLDNGR